MEPLTNPNAPHTPPAVQALVDATREAERRCREAVWAWAAGGELLDLARAFKTWCDAARAEWEAHGVPAGSSGMRDEGGGGLPATALPAHGLPPEDGWTEDRYGPHVRFAEPIRERPCPECGGKGGMVLEVDERTGVVVTGDCPTCHGTGTVRSLPPPEPGTAYLNVCPTCRGDGDVPHWLADPCPSCNREGFVRPLPPEQPAGLHRRAGDTSASIGRRSDDH